MFRLLFRICLFLSLPGFSTSLQAQDYPLFYPLKSQMKLDYHTIQEKSQNINHHTYSLVQKTASSNCLQFVVEDEIVTHKNRMLYHQFTMSCKDGRFYIGMDRYFNPRRLETYRDMDIQIEIDSLELPPFSKVSEMLPGGSASAKILKGSGTPLFQLKVYIVNRRFDSIDSIATPAGTFKCCRISFEMIEIMGASRQKTQHLEWYAPKIGLIRSEVYNRKGKLLAHTLLNSIGEEFLLP